MWCSRYLLNRDGEPEEDADLDQLAREIHADFEGETESILARVPAGRLQLLWDIANDEWVDRIPDDKRGDAAYFAEQQALWAGRREEFLRETTDPNELHAFAHIWNWDNGTESLRTLVGHPCCDLGTAMMVFWSAEPEVFLLEKEYLEANGEEVRLLRTIQDRVEAGSYRTASIAFEPYADWDDASELPPSERLERRYYEPVGG